MLAVLLPLLICSAFFAGFLYFFRPEFLSWEYCKEYAQRYPRWTTWMLSVVSCHVLLLLYIGFEGSKVVSIKPTQVLVQTVKLNEPAPAKTQPKSKPREYAVAKPPPPPKPKPKKEPPKKEAPKKVASKKTVSKPKPKPVAKKSSKPEIDPKTQELLAEVRNRLEKVKKEESSKQKAAPDVKPVQSLSVDAKPRAQDPSPAQAKAYEDELIKRLQMQLRLPDYGAVRVRLRVQRNGKVAGLEIISSESAVNAAYIRDIVPTLVLAEFGERFPKQEAHEFVLTLTNDF